MKTKLHLMFAAALLMPCFAGAEGSPMADKMAPAATMPAQTESEALAVLMAVNDHEIRASQMAQTKGLRPAVMDYAKMLEKEHTDNQTKTAAVAKYASVTPADTAGVKALKAKTQTERETLSQLEPAKFEDAFVKAMVDGHAEVLRELDKELIPSAKNPTLAQHLRDTRVHIAMHLEKAEALAAE